MTSKKEERATNLLVPEGFEFTSSTKWEDSEADTLVVRCSDHRLRTHFEELLQNGLRLPPNSYDLLVVPGGPQFLFASDLVMPKYEWAGKNWLKFLVEGHKLKKIILLAHHGCSWYKLLNPGEHTTFFLRERQLEDLRKVPAKIKTILPQISTRMFYAQPKGEHVHFTEITA